MIRGPELELAKFVRMSTNFSRFESVSFIALRALTTLTASKLNIATLFEGTPAINARACKNPSCKLDVKFEGDRGRSTTKTTAVCVQALDEFAAMAE